ncbi:SDR family NAD(P)-dependent oxidoreductase [Streptomyces jeddahensis]|uniref:3-oxoacyl-[acyl-carrier-protein] reductase FabG n=1 Tax=Streptomyces jeddahensis TaxID=1716141 RepID=A0A177HEA2_9ACTN|nr:SDR family oxidoreductase [Streptomyces jeddahensis]OAH09252.1 3-oxoacyl-[acyl-carrier-protein] reductase FabG [Streptomyces jeddahensis]
MTHSGSDVAIVTGAASGIGRAAALRLADSGWAVAAVDISDTGLDSLADRGPSIRPFVCDITDPQALADTVDRISKEIGSPRRLVHCAGIADLGKLLDQDPADTLRLMNVIYGGTLRLVHAVVPAMASRGGGQIILLGSIAGWVPVPEGGGYGAAKAAPHFLAETLSAECRERGIHVLCVCPPAVETPMLDRMRRDAPAMFGPRPGLTTDAVLDSMDRALARGRLWAFPGRGTHAMWTARRMAPGVLSQIMARTIVRQ